jgi:hypothetical protein
MARKVQTFTIDDLDGSEGASTVRFGLDGQTFEVDLSEANEKALREDLADYIAVARKAGSGGVKAQGARTDRAVAKAMREFAVAHGFEVKSRGRVPREVVTAFQAANA